MRISVQGEAASLVRAPADSPGTQGVSVRDIDSGKTLPAQYDEVSGQLAFVAGSGTYEVVPGGSDSAPYQTEVVHKLDRVNLHVGGEFFATYVLAGGRRPYFWPLLGPSGSTVVRGQGSGDHPHHTGLAVSYGGHSEGGSANIWSDWDEPPYGPGGRMLHQGFRKMYGGPVYGELVQDLAYVDALGDRIVSEVRTIRWWWASAHARYLDIECRVLEVTDRGPRPFILMARTPMSFGIPENGAVTNSAKAATPDLVYSEDKRYRASWVDASGPSGPPPPPPPPGPPEDLVDLREDAATYAEVGTGPWNGIAVLDHPSNHGFPNVVGKYAMVQQITQAHYPPPEAPDGPFTFQQRIYVHDGNAADAQVAAVAATYEAGPQTEVME